jgi:carbon storage regulator
MLVLSRKPAEAILIGNDIKITVLEVRGQRVRLGIAAPANVAIARSELSEFWVDAPATPLAPPIVEEAAEPVHA